MEAIRNPLYRSCREDAARNMGYHAASWLEGDSSTELDHARSAHAELAVDACRLAEAGIQEDRFRCVSGHAIDYAVFRQVQGGAEILRAEAGMIEQVVGFAAKLDGALVLFSGKRDILEQGNVPGLHSTRADLIRSPGYGCPKTGTTGLPLESRPRYAGATSLYWRPPSN
jgi:hypothetical protein